MVFEVVTCAVFGAVSAFESAVVVVPPAIVERTMNKLIAVKFKISV
jgi:hypothetical protein